MKSIGSFSLAASILCFLLPPAHGLTVYNDTAVDTFTALAYAGTYTQLGDQVSLLPGSFRIATQATVELFNIGTAGTFDATLRLFNVGSPVGTQLGGDFVRTGIAAPDGDVVDIVFTLPNLVVPDNLIFTVSVGNSSSGVNIIGPELYEPPPTIGASDPTFAIGNDGSGFVQVSTGGDLAPGSNVFFDLQANSPEPSTLTLAAAALLLFVARASRPARRTAS